MPALSPTMKQGNLVTWKKAEGDRVDAGDVLAEIETDKAVVDLESQDEGVLAKIVVAAGAQDVPVGRLIAVLAEDEGDWKALQAREWAEESGSKAASSPSATSAETSAGAATAPEPARKTPAVYGPAVATLLARHPELDLERDIQPTGPKGRILKEDVLRALAAKASAGARAETRRETATAASATAAPTPAPDTDTGYTDIPLSQVRRVIAERLLESKRNQPHAYQSISATVDRLTALRQSMNAMAAERPHAKIPKLTVNDFIMRAVAMALREHRRLNSGEAQVDLAFAVATPLGLITPIVRSADSKNIMSMAMEMQDLVRRARDNKLKLHEFQGGTFSVSNLGMVKAITRFTAIMNPPQAGILAIGAPQQRVVVAAADERGGGHGSDRVRMRQETTLTLSYDARRVSASISSAFLVDVKRLLEQPEMLLL
ncbi:hypothetical protein CDCA_CDCA01G0133 [Cyanidium caldarium]|uniref:Dihydrolipoamide acetyltransferase component of pyruvate dehydrogenase complex n=1 Tax=Cyanidium caldarium TaxID=2771 RepID=A0AAV9IQ58_CYACA|nr:hypothetical protein CDCA_CDCA01G0133 [Cyanidium caldarium]